MAQKREVVIVGGGPAGLAAGLYTGRAMMETVVLEKLAVGGQIAGAYDVDNYPGFPDGVSGGELAELMLKQVEKFGVDVVYDEATDIAQDGTMKSVITLKGEYEAPIVIIASGASHRKLGVPGEQKLSGSGVSYCATCDGPFFHGKRLVVVGGGDASLTESLFLTRFASQIKLVHRRQGFRARTTYIDEAKANEKIQFVLDTVVKEIVGDKKVEGVVVSNVLSGEEHFIECDGVFVFIGSDPNTRFLKTLMPRYAGKVLPVDLNMETDMRGVYAVGDVRKGSFRQLGTAVGEGVTAAIHAETRLKTLLAGRG